MKIYAVKGQNCQNKRFNFPWTTLVLKDQNYSTGSPNFVVFHFVGICIFSEKKGKSSNFSVTKWNPFRFKVVFLRNYCRWSSANTESPCLTHMMGPGKNHVRQNRALRGYYYLVSVLINLQNVLRLRNQSQMRLLLHSICLKCYVNVLK